MKDKQSSNDLLNKISGLSYSASVEGIATNIIETADACKLITQYLNELQPQWVSVGDRLPIIRTDGAHAQISVLATDGENVCQVNFHSGSTPTDWYEWSEYGDIEPALITHWQPLPATTKRRPINTRHAQPIDIY